jgi:hypothetical protein
MDATGDVLVDDEASMKGLAVSRAECSGDGRGQQVAALAVAVGRDPDADADERVRPTWPRGGIRQDGDVLLPIRREIPRPRSTWTGHAQGVDVDGKEAVTHQSSVLYASSLPTFRTTIIYIFSHAHFFVWPRFVVPRECD